MLGEEDALKEFNGNVSFTAMPFKIQTFTTVYFEHHFCIFMCLLARLCVYVGITIFNEIIQRNSLIILFVQVFHFY